MENLQSSKVLVELGLNEKNQWILYDEKPRKFFEYIAENLDEDNILTEKELKKYNDLVSAGLFLEGEALTEQMKTLESYFPGILSITDESVEEMERELKFLEADTQEREARILRMEETEKQLSNEIEVLEKKQIEIDYQEKQLTLECTEKAKILTELQQSNQQLIIHLNEIYTQPQNPPCLIYQMPLDQHFHKCDQLLGQLEVFMRKHFNVTNSAEEVENDWISSSSIIEIKKQIVEIEKKKFADQATYEGYSHIIQNIEKFKNQVSGDYSEMRAVIDDMEVESENMTLQFEVIQREVDMLLEQSADQQILKLSDEYFKGKHKRALQRLDTIRSIQDVTENVTILSELLWVVMQLDLERLKNRTDNTEEISTQAQDCLKRIRQMKIIAKRAPEASFNDFILEKFHDLLSNPLSLKQDQLPTITACLQEIIKFEDTTEMKIKSSVAQENLAKFHAIIKNIDDQSELLREFIFNGPTNRPQLYDTKFTMDIYNREQKTKETEKLFYSIKSSYKKNIVEPLETDRFFKMERNLWVYFLTEPKKVLECIKEVKKEAAEKGTQSFKALNITLSKAS